MSKKRRNERTMTQPTNSHEQAALDSEGLAPLHERGWVSHVNGPMAQLCPKYQPTRYELRELARH